MTPWERVEEAKNTAVANLLSQLKRVTSLDLMECYSCYMQLANCDPTKHKMSLFCWAQKQGLDWGLRHEELALHDPQR